MNRYDMYIGKNLHCCSGDDCGETYEVISDVYEKNGEEYIDFKNDKTGEIKNVDVDYLDNYSNY